MARRAGLWLDGAEVGSARRAVFSGLDRVWVPLVSAGAGLAALSEHSTLSGLLVEQGDVGAEVPRGLGDLPVSTGFREQLNQGSALAGHLVSGVLHEVRLLRQLDGTVFRVDANPVLGPSLVPFPGFREVRRRLSQRSAFGAQCVDPLRRPPSGRERTPLQILGPSPDLVVDLVYGAVERALVARFRPSQVGQPRVEGGFGLYRAAQQRLQRGSAVARLLEGGDPSFEGGLLGAQGGDLAHRRSVAGLGGDHRLQTSARGRRGASGGHGRDQQRPQ